MGEFLPLRGQVALVTLGVGLFPILYALMMRRLLAAALAQNQPIYMWALRIGCFTYAAFFALISIGLGSHWLLIAAAPVVCIVGLLIAYGARKTTQLTWVGPSVSKTGETVPGSPDSRVEQNEHAHPSSDEQTRQ